MTRINTTLRRWCDTCGRYTRSKLDNEGNEICAEHQEASGDDD
jgi:hypothetical protein